jgi:uncharacterized DUF497 family protein
VAKVRFEWDPKKDKANQKKHGVSFSAAQLAFLDPNRVIVEDPSHSQEEKRYFLFGQVGDGCLTVRFTYRRRKIRIFGAGFWRKGKEIYEEKNQIYRRPKGARKDGNGKSRS